MNRIIKFRVWDKKSRSFANPDNIWSFPLPQYLNGIVFSIPLSEDLIIQQFTGLKDINGKEIYEGDIVKFKLSTELIGEVVWFYNGWSYKVKNLHPREEFPAFNVCNKEKPKIIGNIFENPDLLISPT